jgi:AraC-like DNA-binding protein
MTIVYNNDRIKKIIDDLHSITGLSLAFMDLDGGFVYKRLKTDDDFCNTILTTAEGRRRCKCSDDDMMQRCAQTLMPVSHICHAGVLDTMVPIIKNGVLTGYMVIGRIRLSDSAKEISDKLTWLGEKAEATLNFYSRLSYFKREQLDSLVDIISNIIFESAISIVQDDVALAAAEYVDRNISSPLTVKEICSSLFVSKNRLYKDFHNTYGMTVNDYITDKRIEKAKELLTEGDEHLTKIAEMVGIGNYPYFCELFKKKCGETPKRYREKMRAQRTYPKAVF